MECGSAIDSIIRLIIRRARTGTWEVTADELSVFYGELVYYRAAYAAGLLGVERFGEANSGELTRLLDELGETDSAGLLHRAGVLLTLDERIDLT